MKYRIYIDEVGNPDIESSDDPNHRFLSLTGVIVELGYVQTTLHPEMEDLKSRHFGPHPDDPIVLHRKEILNARPSFEGLRDAEARVRFDDELLSSLRRWEYTVVTVCLDKKAHKERYHIWQYHPYHYCLAVMLERFVFFLDSVEAQGDVIAESRGGNEDRKLKASFENLWRRGTDFLRPDRFQTRLTSRQLKVKPKANNIAGLQVADLIAHPSRNEILCEKGLRERPPGPFGSKIIGILQDKYYRRGGKIDGSGKKFL